MQRLYKKQKLCSEIAISQLFDRGRGETRSKTCFPLRAVWRRNDARQVTCPRFLISIPKKRLRHAVDRVKMRRRVREAFRLHQQLLPADLPVDMAFIYVTGELVDYATVEEAMVRILARIKGEQPWE